MNREDEKINVWGARVHNLKNVEQFIDGYHGTLWLG